MTTFWVAICRRDRRRVGWRHRRAVSGAAVRSAAVEARRLDVLMTTPTPPVATTEPSRPGRSWPPRRRVVLIGVGVVAALVLIIGVMAVLAPQPFDRALAIDRAVDASGGRLTPRQAACYVDRVRADLGPSYLAPDASIPARVADRLTKIRDDCVGLGHLADSGAATGAGAVPSTEGGDQPLHHGQDAALDQLWARCASGYGHDCDELFTRSPIGSEYEAFALTCGGRTRERVCGARYVSPGVTVTSPTQVPGP